MPFTDVIRRRSSRHRRARWVLVVVLLLLAIGASTPLWAPDRFRDDLTKMVTYRIDRPATIGDLSVRLVPRPTLVARNVAIGHPEFNVRADRVLLEISLAALSRRVVDVQSIRIDGLVWTVPERPGDLADQINALEFRAGRGGGNWSAVIGRAYAEDARVVFAGQDESVLNGDVDVRDLLEDTITLTVAAAAPIAGETARLDGTATFTKRPTGEPTLAFEGSASLKDVDSRAFVDEDVIPNTQLDFASIKFVRTGADAVTIQMSGDSYPASAAAEELDALAGAFNATAIWQDGETSVRIDEWRAPGFEFAGDIDVDKEGAVNMSIARGAANAAGIEAYFKLRPLAGYTVKPASDARLNVKDLGVQRAPDGGLALSGGAAEFSGVDLLVEDGAQAFTGFSGGFMISDNVISLDSITGSGLMIAGTVVPDFAEESYRFSLNGEVELTPERLSGFMEIDQIKEATGRILITNLQGTATSGGGIPDDLVIEGKLVDGRFRIDSPEWSDTVENAVLTFSAENEVIGTAGSAQTAMFGTVSIDGTFIAEEDRWAGIVSGDFSTVSLPSLRGTTREVAENILGELGRSDLDVALTMPGEDAENIKVDVTRQGEAPTLVAAVNFDRNEDSWVLRDVTVAANLASHVLAPLTPDSMSATGPMDVQFGRSAADQRFRADVDLSAANISLGEHLNKGSGSPFTLSIDGRADDEQWIAEVIDAVIIDTKIRAALDGERFIVERFDVDVAALAPLLREGGSASGRVTGSIRTNPTDVTLNMREVRVALSDNLVADYIDGGLRVTNEGIQADTLRVNAANSEFTLNLRETEGRWSGGIRGAQVDANALTQWLNEYRSLSEPGPRTAQTVTVDTVESGQSMLAGTAEDEPTETSDSASQIQEEPNELEGEFDVNVDTLLYRKASLSTVRTRLVASGGNYTANSLSFVPNTGLASGNVRYSRGEPPYGNRIVADLVFEGVEAKIIDDLAFEKPRNLKGLMTGNAMLSLPIGESGVELSGINGSVQIRGTDGTLGSLGFANAILFVFKTTEILFLRSPFGENGLSFDELNGKASVENGRITLGVFEDGLYAEAVTLQRPSYRMSAIGWVDLDQWDSEIIVHMKPLSSVADAARIFKIDEVEAINNKGGIRIRMTGPPDDPKTQIAFGGPVNAITGEIRDGFRSVQGLVRDQIIEGIGGLLREVLER